MKINSMYVRPNREDLNATAVPSMEDIAWSAGVYEGEGTARLCGSNSKTGKIKRGLAVSVPQKDPEILYRMRDWFGGSVCTGKHVCTTWNICGDRARIFLALIYKFMSARRREQIDATCALEFLRGESPLGLSSDQLKSRLLAVYEEHKETTWRGSASIQKSGKAALYAKKKQDPAFAKRVYEQNKAQREGLTEEQRQERNRLARAKYLDKKGLKLVNTQRIDATA